MKRLLLLSLFLPGLACAQLQVYLAPQNAPETPISGVVDLGSVAVGDSASIRVRIRNMGQSSSTLSVLQVAGAGFSVSGAPSLPFVIAPSLNVDLTVRFSPANAGSYSANLQVNGTGVILRATGMPGAVLTRNGADLVPGAEIDLGRIERGTNSAVTLRLTNPARDPATVQSILVTGAGFTLSSNGSSFPALIMPGQYLDFSVNFAPSLSGISQGVLTIDKRDFRLTATAFEPALPRPTVILETPAVRSGEQGRVSVRLASPSRSFVKGQLRMELRPAGQVRDNDASAMFTAGSRTLSFDINPGDEIVKLRGETSAVFQAGTTAGVLVFIVEAGGFTEQTSTAVAAEVVHVEKASAARTGSGIEVTLTGFDNSRSVGDLSFTFYSPDGQPLPGMPLRLNASSEFGNWWASSTGGGVFQLRAVFPVTGDSTRITAVQASVANTTGTAATDKLSF